MVIEMKILWSEVRNKTRGIRILMLMTFPVLAVAQQHSAANHGNVAVRSFNVTTQGPLWPPSTLVDENGDFIVVGQILKEISPGVIAPVPGGAALVAKETIPPLTNDIEDFSNPLAAPYQVIRSLDLSARSRDRDMVLFSPSFGPVSGAFGGGPRIPMEGESEYNLNQVGSVCPEAFAAASQASAFKRPSFPLHQYPILGFQGDQVAYHVDTGEPFDPMTSTGAGCESGCTGENRIDSRRQQPVTLGEWVSARGKMKISLVNYDRRQGGFTAAKFALKFQRLLPDSVYTVWGIRENVLTQGSSPAPLKLPGLFLTDKHGSGEFTAVVENAFPERSEDSEGLRIVGIEISYHPDYQNWGACPERFGIGYRAMSWFDFLPDGGRDLSDFITYSRNH